MGKSKKGGRKQEDSDEEVSIKTEKTTKGRKGKKNEEISDNEDTVEVEAQKNKKKEKRKDKKAKKTAVQTNDSDIESDPDKNNVESDEEAFTKKKSKPKSGFAALMDDDEDSEEEPLPVPKNKSKNNKKNAFAMLEADDESEEEQLPVSKAKSKNKKSAFAMLEDLEDDSEEEPLPVPKSKSKNKNKNKKGFAALEAEVEDSEPEEKTNTGFGGFMMLDDDEENEEVDIDEDVDETGPTSKFAMLGEPESDDPDKVSSAEEEVVVVEKKKKDKKKDKKEDKKGKKGKGKKGKDDLDELFAELNIEIKKDDKKDKKKKKQKEKSQSVEKEKTDAVEPDATADVDTEVKEERGAEDVPMEDGTEVESKKSKKKKKPKQKVEEPSREDTPETEVSELAEVTDAKPKVEGSKKKGKGKKIVEESESVPDDVEVEETPAEESGKKGKKGDKKKEDKKDDKKKKLKGPGKGMVAALQEALKKQQEEEEARLRAENEKIRKIEQAEAARIKKIKQEKAAKEKLKQKKKEEIERMKKEGTYKTPKQLEEQRKAQARIEAMKAAGLTIPTPKAPGAKTKDKRKQNEARRKALQQQESQPGQNDSSAPPTPAAVEIQKVELQIVDPAVADEDSSKTEEPVGAEDSDDVKDAWDVDSEEESKVVAAAPVASKPVAAPAATKAPAPPAAESGSEEEEDSEEESSEEESSSEESSSSEEEDDRLSEAQKRREKAIQRIKARKLRNEKEKSLDELRAPVIVVLGHVDTGKTKILDKLRRTNVQEGEAGGITQQIGATNVPLDAVQNQCKMVDGVSEFKFKIPGMLIIDTPGHESFSNLRSRGSSLCDIAILVVDLMHGIEPQTIESIGLLKKGKTPFVVALNKIDRLYDWKPNKNKDVRDVIKSQSRMTLQEFEDKKDNVILQFAEQGLNVKLFYENPDNRTYINLIPTSAVSGDGMGNLMFLLSDLTQNMLTKRICYSKELQASVMEVKQIPGLGTTIDVILINGSIKEHETVVLAGTDGPIVTEIRSLLMPQPLKELRVKNAYEEFNEIKAAQGVKIAAKELEKAIAGLNLLVAHHPDEVDILRAEVERDYRKVMSQIKVKDKGVYVQASTLGSLEALLEFLRSSEIPYCAVRIGPVVKKDVMKASAMLDHNNEVFATILAFDVKVEREAQEMADNVGVKIFQADIIYHLFDSFIAYRDQLKQKKREQFASIAVFPCKLKVLPQFIFNSRDPIVMGVSVEAGILKEGTPICVPSKEFICLGNVGSLELNNKPVQTARKGQEVCIKIDPYPGEAPKMFGRHFDEKDMLTCKITRESIDACKNYFRDDLLKSDWQLMVELKKLFSII